MTKVDIQSDVGSLQLRAGFNTGCEAGIHVTHSIFERDETEGVILVDVKNAFNSLNLAATFIIFKFCALVQYLF